MSVPNNGGRRQTGIDALLERGVAAFTRRFGHRPAAAASAPGRVNLIGDHTDYCQGFALPMAITRSTVALAAPSRGDHSTFVSLDLDESARHSLRAGTTVPGGWERYAVGVAEGLLARGFAFGEIDLVVVSSIPIGAGLASSAALELATATAIETMIDVRLEADEKAELCRQAEVGGGTPCGIMDQLIGIRAEPGRAVLIDFRSLESRAFDLPSGTTVLVVDSGVRRKLAAGVYATRRRACEAAAERLGLASLREATLAAIGACPLDEESCRRATHVVTENTRTLLAAAALERGDPVTMGELMDASHVSLRDLFDVSCPELDTVVESARRLGPSAGVFGARLTGAGLGGCVIVLVAEANASSIRERLGGEFADRHGRVPDIFEAGSAGPTRALTLD